MEFLLAVVAVAVTLWLARGRHLHPGDYLVAAALAVTFALFVLALTPSGAQNHALIQLGAPLSSIAQAEFLAANGVKIALAAVLFAIGACISAVVRRRMTPEQVRLSDWPAAAAAGASALAPQRQRRVDAGRSPRRPHGGEERNSGHRGHAEHEGPGLERRHLEQQAAGGPGETAAPDSPTTRPTPTIARVLRATSESTSPGAAPSAMRMPISRRRCATACERTP